MSVPQDPAETSNFSRRGFVFTLLASGFAAAVQPVCAQTIATDTKGLLAEELELPTADRPIPAYQACPETGGPFPIVLVVQEIFGVHEHIRDVCRRLAKLGYLAVAPELYARQGDPSKAPDSATLMRDIVAKVADAQVLSDLDSAAAWAAANGGGGKLGITGFCWGGRVVWMYAAHNPKLAAGVAWYGPTSRSYHPGDPTALDVAPRIKAAILGLYGGADAGIPVETVEKAAAAVRAAGNPRVEIVVYPAAPHAFHADYRSTYRKDAAEAGWKRLTDWFGRYLA
jgi:carboxymethylenebutenolidase